VVQQDHVPDDFGIVAFRRNGKQRFFDDLRDVIFKKGFGIKGGHEGSAIHSIAVIHDMSGFIGQLVSGDRHSRAHESDVVGFDLEVDIIGMEVIIGVSRPGREDAVEKVLPGLHIGVPEGVACLGEEFLGFLCRGVRAIAVHGHQEGELDIDVILPEGAFDVAGNPVDGIFIGLSLGPEFGWGAIGHPDHFACPASGDFVLQGIRWDFPELT